MSWSFEKKKKKTTSASWERERVSIDWLDFQWKLHFQSLSFFGNDSSIGFSPWMTSDWQLPRVARLALHLSGADFERQAKKWKTSTAKDWRTSKVSKEVNLSKLSQLETHWVYSIQNLLALFESHFGTSSRSAPAANKTRLPAGGVALQSQKNVVMLFAWHGAPKCQRSKDFKKIPKIIFSKRSESKADVECLDIWFDIWHFGFSDIFWTTDFFLSIPAPLPRGDCQLPQLGLWHRSFWQRKPGMEGPKKGVYCKNRWKRYVFYRRLYFLWISMFEFRYVRLGCCNKNLMNLCNRLQNRISDLELSRLDSSAETRSFRVVAIVTHGEAVCAKRLFGSNKKL